MAIQFDNKISLGHVISLGGVLAAGLMGWATLQSTQAALVTEVAKMEVEVDAFRLAVPRIRAVSERNSSTIVEQSNVLATHRGLLFALEKEVALTDQKQQAILDAIGDLR